jgi:vacuolar-type H+-ATPase subunit C/Vma6
MESTFSNSIHRGYFSGLKENNYENVLECESRDQMGLIEEQTRHKKYYDAVSYV